MPMRHPLTDLPLDKFAVSFEPRASTKRPLSPSAALLSPSKRRILSAEGLYSPEKKRHSNPSKQLFSEFVEPPPSPARRLDFTKLSHPSPRKPSSTHARNTSPRPETPITSIGGAPTLAPSPEIASSSSADASTSFSGRNHPDVVPESSHTRALPPLMLIPREMPAFSDRTSHHWPGFDVHPDTHISIPISYPITRRMDEVDASNEDDAKENLRPSRRTGKRLASEEGTPGKPAKLGRTDRHVQETGINIMSTLMPFPGTRSMTPHEKHQGRKQMRLIMELEMDEEDDVDDVDNQL